MTPKYNYSWFANVRIKSQIALKIIMRNILKINIRHNHNKRNLTLTTYNEHNKDCKNNNNGEIE